MARYDVSLADERGAVRADQHRDWSDFRTRGRDRDIDPRRATAWREPGDVRGYRGGGAGSYGFGEDYETVRGGAGREGRRDVLGTGRTPPLGSRGGYDREQRGMMRGRGGYDRTSQGLRQREPLAREIQDENADLVADYVRREPGYRARGGWDMDELARGRGGGYGADFDIGRGRRMRGSGGREFRGSRGGYGGEFRNGGGQNRFGTEQRETRDRDVRRLRGSRDTGVYGGRARSSDTYDIAYRNFHYGG